MKNFPRVKFSCIIWERKRFFLIYGESINYRSLMHFKRTDIRFTFGTFPLKGFIIRMIMYDIYIYVSYSDNPFSAGTRFYSTRKYF